MDLMELLNIIPDEQEIRLITNEEKILYSGKCGSLPFSVLKEAETMVMLSVMATSDKLGILLENFEDFPFGADDDDFEDFEGGLPFD